MSCHLNCLTCSGTSFTQCLTCRVPLLLHQGSCYCQNYLQQQALGCDSELGLLALFQTIYILSFVYVVIVILLLELNFVLPVSLRIINFLQGISFLLFRQQYIDWKQQQSYRSIYLFNGGRWTQRWNRTSLKEGFSVALMLVINTLFWILAYFASTIKPNQKYSSFIDYFKTQFKKYIFILYYFTTPEMVLYIIKFFQNPQVDQRATLVTAYLLFLAVFVVALVYFYQNDSIPFISTGLVQRQPLLFNLLLGKILLPFSILLTNLQYLVFVGLFIIFIIFLIVQGYQRKYLILVFIELTGWLLDSIIGGIKLWQFTISVVLFYLAIGIAEIIYCRYSGLVLISSEQQKKVIAQTDYSQEDDNKKVQKVQSIKENIGQIQI